jgi:hypothetical protein
MKASDKKLIATILQALPLVLGAVMLQCFGLVLLGFVIFSAFPEQQWLTKTVIFPYLCWSSWCLLKYIAKLSKRYYHS